MAAITEHHLESSDEVKEHTRASGSCGGRPMVDALVKYMRSGKRKEGLLTEARTPIEVPVCECTVLGPSSLKQAVVHAVDQGCHSVQDFMLQQGWKKPGGCEVCRPALRFYFDIEMTGAVHHDERRQSNKASDDVFIRVQGPIRGQGMGGRHGRI